MNSEKGITLVEVMLASIIFLFISLGSIYFFGAGSEKGAKAKHVGYAVGLAERGLEELKAWSYDNVAVSVAASAAPQTYQRYGVDFRKGYTQTPSPDYNVYSVSVTWTNADGQQQNIELFTILP